MKWYWVRTHSLVKRLLSGYIWDVPNKDNHVYLTFDDGPTPQITDFVLDELAKHDARATFFCIGKNVRENQELFERISASGHAIGNHTDSHLNGWNTPLRAYLQNIADCEKAIGTANGYKLFRPPYGKLTRAQLTTVKALGYKTIMWDVLSADFDTSITPEKCLQNVLRNVRPGSIVIFHDSQKAEKNLRHALPATLEFLKEKGMKAMPLF